MISRTSSSARSAALAVLLLLCSCGRAAVDESSSALSASSAPAATERSAAPASVTLEGPVWSVAELAKHRELAPGELVTVQGILTHFELCRACPADVACAPCDSVHFLAEASDSPREKTVGIRSGLLEGQASFEVGKHYAFRAKLLSWDDAGVQPKVFVELIYVAHQLLD